MVTEEETAIAEEDPTTDFIKLKVYKSYDLYTFLLCKEDYEFSVSVSIDAILRKNPRVLFLSARRPTVCP